MTNQAQNHLTLKLNLLNFRGAACKCGNQKLITIYDQLAASRSGKAAAFPQAAALGAFPLRLAENYYDFGPAA